MKDNFSIKDKVFVRKITKKQFEEIKNKEKINNFLQQNKTEESK